MGSEPVSGRENPINNPSSHPSLTLTQIFSLLIRLHYSDTPISDATGSTASNFDIYDYWPGFWIWLSGSENGLEVRKKNRQNEKLILYPFWKLLVKRRGGGASVPHPLTAERRETDSEETQHKADEAIKTRAAAPRNDVMCEHQKQKHLPKSLALQVF